MARRKQVIDLSDPDRPNRIMVPLGVPCNVDDLTGETGGVVSYRASAVGGCSRALVCAGLGHEAMPVPEWLMERYQEGHILEPQVLDLCRSGRTFKLLHNDDPLGNGTVNVHVDENSEQQVQVLAVGSVEIDGDTYRVIVQAHSDAMGRYTTDGIDVTRCDIEVKCLADSLWGRFVKHGITDIGEYAWQASARMHAHGLPILFVVARKKGRLNDGTLEIADVACQVLTEPPVPLREFKKKLLKIESRIADCAEVGVGGAMDTESGLPACDHNQYPCPYYYLHDETNDETRTRVDDELLAGQVTAYLEAAEREREAKKTKETLMAGIRGWMEANGLGGEGGKADVGGTKVTWVEYWAEERITPAGLVKFVKVTPGNAKPKGKGRSK